MFGVWQIFSSLGKKRKRKKKVDLVLPPKKEVLYLMIWRESLFGIAYWALVHLIQHTALKEMRSILE